MLVLKFYLLKEEKKPQIFEWKPHFQIKKDQRKPQLAISVSYTYCIRKAAVIQEQNPYK